MKIFVRIIMSYNKTNSEFLRKEKVFEELMAKNCTKM